MRAIIGARSGARTIGLASLMLALALALTCIAQEKQKPDESSSEMHQMIVTTQGFLAIDTPKGWVQSEGPGLAFFLPEGVDRHSAEVWIYISGAPVGPNEEDRDAKAYIQSDIAGYKQHFKNGVVREEEPIFIPQTKQQAPCYSFQSGESHNAFEQVVYIDDGNRVLTLTISAKNSAALKRSLGSFHEFAQSYRGSIQMGSGDDKK